MKPKTTSADQWKNPSFVQNEGARYVSETFLRGRVLRQKVAGGWALGTFLIEVPTASTLSALSLAGYDFVVLDMEHSSIDFSVLEILINAGHAAGITMLVRTWGEDTGLIGKVLDIGAHGIMAPHVDTPERAAEVVSQARFAPRGHRGFSPLAKFDCLSEPLREMGDATFVVVQIEGRDALERVSEIAAVPGIDAVFVGPYDLALSLSVTPGSDAVYAAAEQIAEAVPQNVHLGIYIDDPADCARWAGRRFALQCVSFDGRMLSNGVRGIAELARLTMKRSKENI